MATHKNRGGFGSACAALMLVALAGCSGLLPWKHNSDGTSAKSLPAKSLTVKVTAPEPEEDAPLRPARSLDDWGASAPPAPRFENLPTTQDKPAEISAPAPAASVYRIQPGDLLTVSVWKEADLQTEVVVRPDGGISLPLANEVAVAGHTVDEVRAAIEERLRKYIPDPVVTVALKQISGNRIYVVGKVNRPGDFPLTGAINVMQALGLAGGATPFASLNKVRILRHEGGKETAFKFRYYEVESGHKLEQNILLHSGDTVVVP